MSATLALAAMLAELATGYPGALYRRIGHPVTWIGRAIGAFEARWNGGNRTPAERRRSGAILVLLLLVGSIALGVALQMLAGLAGLSGFVLLALVAGSLLAQRSLHQHVAAVADALEGDGIEAARRAVAQIVGRDPDALDESAIARASIESLAENFSDAVVAPVFWLALGGLGGVLAYKAINTADSMIGHRNERYADFGRAAARLDDWINLPASRLSALLVAFAAMFRPRADAGQALAIVRHDARHHRSPNAGWPEAAFAGALGISLAGPRRYGGVITTNRAMNETGRAALDASDIREALALYRRADAVLIVLLVLICAGLWGLSR